MLEVPEKILKAAQEFKDVLLREKKVTIFHDTDQDGIVSGALLQDLLERNGISVTAHAKDRDKVEFEPGKVYVLADIRLSESILKKARKNEVKLYYIDHHEPDNIPTDAKVTVLNPHLLGDVGVDPFRWNTALLAWVVRGMDEESDWKAAAAHWADHCIGPHSERWMEEVYQKYGEDVIVKTAQLLGLAEHFPNEITEDEMREIVKVATTPKEILTHPILQKLDKVFSSEFKRLYNEILATPIHQDEHLVYHIVSSPVRKIKSTLATQISDKEPNRVWIIGQEEDGMINFSLRCQNAVELGIHLGEIAKEAAEKFGGRGGGHPPAAGLRIPKDREEAFRRWIIERIKKEIR